MISIFLFLGNITLGKISWKIIYSILLKGPWSDLILLFKRSFWVTGHLLKNRNFPQKSKPWWSCNEKIMVGFGYLCYFCYCILFPVTMIYPHIGNEMKFIWSIVNHTFTTKFVLIAISVIDVIPFFHLWR